MVILRKISALMMALFILLTTTGFALHKHHCTVTKETITSVAHVKDCCGTEEEQQCPKRCCQNDTEYIQIDAELTLPATVHEFSLEQFVAVLQYCIFNDLFNVETKGSVRYVNYKPPLLLRDIPVLIRSFLI